MRRIALAPLAIALAALAACGGNGGGTAGNAAGGAPIANVPPPAGTTWSRQIVATPEGGFRMGNPDAPIKIIEFGSYTCPHCREFTEKAEAALAGYVDTGKVSFEYRNFVRDGLDMTVALLARCGGPEPFFPLNLQFFQNQDAMIQAIQAGGEAGYQSAISAPPAQRFVRMAEISGLLEYAKQRGIPEDRARQCLADVKAAETLATGVERATQQYQITGTPTIVMNGTRLDNVATWEALVERLKAAGV